ncbi:hypothetical protein TrRE_jg5267, partial [Triparma retinervis]
SEEKFFLLVLKLQTFAALNISKMSSTYPISVLDYGAGNVLSLLNSLSLLGYTNVTTITTPAQVSSATCIIFPGVGSFGLAMENLSAMGVRDALVDHIKSDKPYFGICLGMQVLFEESDESPGVPGLGLIKGNVGKFQPVDGSSGDQYDVREKGSEGGEKGGVRNLGNPRDMAKKYYEEGADEIAFLNITSFRSQVIDDLPLVDLMKETSKHVFVPMTVGGGIRDFKDSSGKTWKGWQVADRYFRAGADKGGREERDICAVTVGRGVEILGAGEIMVNCIDCDGQCGGYDLDLMEAVCKEVNIPVIASSGAGREEHVSEVFEKTNVSAALAAGMFHRGEVEIGSVKRDMREKGLVTRL